MILTTCLTGLALPTWSSNADIFPLLQLVLAEDGELNEAGFREIAGKVMYWMITYEQWRLAEIGVPP